MAKKAQTTALAVKNDFPISIPDDETREILEANLGGETLSVRNLTRIKIPAGGGVVWSVPTLEGDDDMVKEIDALILHTSVNRAYWEKPYGQGESGPPDCSSPNCREAYGDPFPDPETGERNPHIRKCNDCPLSKFGSARDNQGNPTKGQACSMKRTIFFLYPGNWLPMVINIPTASLGNATDYLIGLMGQKKKIYHVVTRLKLQKAKNDKGADYSKVIFSKAMDVPESKIDEVEAYIFEVKSFLAQAAEQMVKERDINGADHPQEVRAAA